MRRTVGSLLVVIAALGVTAAPGGAAPKPKVPLTAVAKITQVGSPCSVSLKVTYSQHGVPVDTLVVQPTTSAFSPLAETISGSLGTHFSETLTFTLRSGGVTGSFAVSAQSGGVSVNGGDVFSNEVTCP